MALRRVYIARDIGEAELLRGLLEQEGIRAVIEGAALSAAVGEVPFTVAGPEIHVDECDHERASRLIDCRRSEIDQYPSTCPRCGYDLTGAPGPRCPECGTPFQVRPAPWTCGRCGERIEAQFTACWNCGAERAATHGAG
ncbi:MAG: DUF2007 domain-containing protein [Phycisphaerae bacterium]|jgi:hypothetical protein